MQFKHFHIIFSRLAFVVYYSLGPGWRCDIVGISALQGQRGSDAAVMNNKKIVCGLNGKPQKRKNIFIKTQDYYVFVFGIGVAGRAMHCNI